MPLGEMAFSVDPVFPRMYTAKAHETLHRVRESKDLGFLKFVDATPMGVF